MPKSMTIAPQQVRQGGWLETAPLPLNRYQPDPRAERERWGSAALRDVHRDMVMIRAFETMLGDIKTQGAYRGIAYDHPGAAHLSIGQEAAVVGLCLPLTPDDLIFGSHRSHGEILAKCARAIRVLPETELQRIMEGYLDGDVLRVIEPAQQWQSVQELARHFILYGVLAEIFARTTGLNRGLGGSMHAFFAPFGSMPNNAIVGGSAPIAAGAALFKRCNRRPGIVVANIGDAAAGCGPTWEAITFCAMEQYRTLWDADVGGAPPMLFNFLNNFYGMGGQTVGETMGFEVLARIGAGVNAEGLHAERVDGYNPLAVAAAVAAKRELLAAGRGPVLLDTITYRLAGHSPSDAGTYRTREEIAQWQEVDCLAGYAAYLKEHALASDAELTEEAERAGDAMELVCRLAVSQEHSPRPDREARLIAGVMFSDGSRTAMADGEPELAGSLADNPRVAAIAKRSRSAFGPDGKPLPRSRVVSIRDALFEALAHRFTVDPTLVAYGEENRDWGGAFAVYRGLTELLPYHRLFNSPIAEAAIVGSAVGYAMSGGRVVVELMYCDFIGRAGDEILNQMAKWQAMSAGVLQLPLVMRVSVGNRYGAQHSQDWSSLLAHIPGLKVYFPATPYDAKGMLNRALQGTDPVVFFESQRLYDYGEEFVAGGVPRDYYEVEEGQPVLRRAGDDLTIVTVGATLYRALEAADELREAHGLSAEVFDARFLNPLDLEPIAASVRKTGRVVLASDACDRGSFLHTVASNLTRLCFEDLDAPPVVVGARNWITPGAEMEQSFFPQKEWILDAIHEELLPLAGHASSTDPTRGELAARARGGI